MQLLPNMNLLALRIDHLWLTANSRATAQEVFFAGAAVTGLPLRF
jgi:hypothetical protein